MKRIAVIPNNSKDIGLVNTKRLVEFLNGKAEIYIDEAYSVLGLNVTLPKARYLTMRNILLFSAVTVLFCRELRNVQKEKFPYWE